MFCASLFRWPVLYLFPPACLGLKNFARSYGNWFTCRPANMLICSCENVKIVIINVLMPSWLANVSVEIQLTWDSPWLLYSYALATPWILPGYSLDTP